MQKSYGVEMSAGGSLLGRLTVSVRECAMLHPQKSAIQILLPNALLA